MTCRIYLDAELVLVHVPGSLEKRELCRWSKRAIPDFRHGSYMVSLTEHKMHQKPIFPNRLCSLLVQHGCEAMPWPRKKKERKSVPTVSYHARDIFISVHQNTLSRGLSRDRVDLGFCDCYKVTRQSVSGPSACGLFFPSSHRQIA